MARRVHKVKYQLDPQNIKSLPMEEIAAILRAADDMIMQGGRTLLAKVLKGSKEKKVLELKMDQCPVYGFYNHLNTSDILVRIDWVILTGYLSVEYDYRLPLLIFTEAGWEIEKETRTTEFLHEFDRMLAGRKKKYDMLYLKDRNRAMIHLLLDKVKTTGDKKYIPLLEAWAEIDYKKVRKRIKRIIHYLNSIDENQIF